MTSPIVAGNTFACGAVGATSGACNEGWTPLSNSDIGTGTLVRDIPAPFCADFRGLNAIQNNDRQCDAGMVGEMRMGGHSGCNCWENLAFQPIDSSGSSYGGDDGPITCLRRFWLGSVGQSPHSILGALIWATWLTLWVLGHFNAMISTARRARRMDCVLGNLCKVHPTTAAISCAACCCRCRCGCSSTRVTEKSWIA
jgi:hypothetical protein